tara:strand:- start:376 stop:537 length:162 start_codon:yes stop_codon:yes gene_type:complete
MDIKRIQQIPVVQPTRKVEREADKHDDARKVPRKRRKRDDDSDDDTNGIDTYA